MVAWSQGAVVHCGRPSDRLTAIADDANILILQADLVIPLGAVQDITFELLDTCDANLVGLYKPTSAADEDFALLHKPIACLAALEGAPPSFRLVRPSRVYPFCVQGDVLVDAKSLRSVPYVLEDLWLFGKHFREIGVGREGQGVEDRGNIHTASWICVRVSR